MRHLKQTLQTNIARLLVAFGLALLPFMAAVPQVAHGQLIEEFMECPEGTGLNCEVGQDGIADLVQTVIQWALGIAFIVAVAVLIYGGFKYILSAGNEESATTGRQAIFNALIGIVIIVLSWVVVQIVYRFISGTGN